MALTGSEEEASLEGDGWSPKQAPPTEGPLPQGNHPPPPLPPRLLSFIVLQNHFFKKNIPKSPDRNVLQTRVLPADVSSSGGILGWKRADLERRHGHQLFVRFGSNVSLCVHLLCPSSGCLRSSSLFGSSTCLSLCLFDRQAVCPT